ncbi:TerD family protein [Peterkaempfera bronchialis]|uniref:TerD family protein n=1 Tax=Peterkaempfera bronchialis TaxID=2126346 RepID=UPI0013B43F59|nr:tellurium resistance protein [Peterkaempfera bronchialis]
MSLSKVTLTKSAPQVSLEKSAARGVLRVNLNWTARPPQQQAPASGGWLKKLQSALAPQPGIDLDLGCLWEFSDGSKGVVQALGNAFTARTADGRVVISLDGDDRSGASVGGENLSIDLAHLDAVRRILVFALIYEGVPNWEQARAVTTVSPADGPAIEVLLDEADPAARVCGVALLENTGGQLSVRREVRYVRGGQDLLDQAYGWGLEWAPGRK